MVASSNPLTNQSNPPAPAIVGTSGSANSPKSECLHIRSTARYRFSSPAVKTLLDSALMSNFIPKKLANDLGIRRTTIDVTVSGLGESVKKVKRQFTATIESKTYFFHYPRVSRHEETYRTSSERNYRHQGHLPIPP